MIRNLVLLAVLLGALAACCEQPIKKTNCWSKMSFVASPECL